MEFTVEEIREARMKKQLQLYSDKLERDMAREREEMLDSDVIEEEDEEETYVLTFGHDNEVIAEKID